MKLMKRYAALLLAIVLMLGMVACGKEAAPEPTLPEETLGPYSTTDSQSFQAFTDELFAELATESTLNLHSFVENPEKMGITDYPIQLGSMDLDSLNDTSDVLEYLNRLKTFDRASLSLSQQLVYDQLLDDLQTSLEYNDLYLYDTTFTPTIGLQVQLPIVFAEYSFNNATDIDNYIQLVSQTDTYYAYLMEIEKMKAKQGLFMEDALADKVVEQCQTFVAGLADNNFLISTFNQRIDEFQGLTDEQRTAYKAANEEAVNNHVIPAYEMLIREIAALKGSCQYEGGLSNKPEGKKYYEYLMKNNVGWSKSIPELDSMVDSYIRKAMADMSKRMLVDATLIDMAETFTFNMDDPEKMLEDLKKKLANDFPEPPAVEYTIKSIDKSLEDFASPAMYFLPPVDNFLKNVIYINEGAATDELYPTMAHEGYPGHMYQTTYFNNTNTCNLRTFLRTNGYTEGWASYVEVYAYSFADTGNASLNQLMAENYFTTLLLYAKIDIGVNYYGWDQSQIKNFLNTYGLGTDEVAAEIYTAMVAEPCNYPCYSIGCMAFISMRETAMSELGDKYNAKEFHRFLMDLGPTTFDLLEKPFRLWLNQEKNK